MFFGLAVIFAYKPASAATRTLLQSFQVEENQQQAAPAPAVEEAIVEFQSTEDMPQAGVSDFAIRDANAISIVSWQGAKNCGESFCVTLKGVSETEPVSFSATNCTIFPMSGTGADVYTVTVTGSGAYTLTAEKNGDSDLARETRTGLAGRADQMPLSILGWGGGDDYYDRFKIQVAGGSTNGAISFQTDGCTVTPAVGTTGTEFEVTVNRVGGYSLTAMMDGNTNYNNVYSALLSGCSSKSTQSQMHIENWISEAKSGETFMVRIYGGSTNEAIALSPVNCSVVKLSSEEYEVTVDAVGPYALTATRPGNYGYNSVSASESGVSVKTRAHTLSVSGWAETKNCNDTFPIKIVGGVDGAPISFVASGCTVSPATGTTETKFSVTITSAGGYSLNAVMGETDQYEAQQTRTYHGQSGKGTQNALQIENWNANAPAGSVFEITVTGGNGTGATTLSTNDGCAARLKNGESNVYVISVYPLAGKDYSVVVNRAGDATYEPSAAATFEGITTGAVQAALAMSGWNNNAFPGSTFDIRLTGGSGNGTIDFAPQGCKVDQGAEAGAYTVTVTALEGESYSLSVTRTGDGNYTPTSIEQSGTARNLEEAAVPQILDPVKTTTYSWIYICGGIVLLFGVVLLIMQIANTPRRRRHRR
ncbi:MAG: hypothetical protein C0413_03250 [Clostridiales bacterium]|nr:hypothetical protein [Clostridiales bacterium]